MRAAVLGPRPGRCRNATSPSGTCARRLESAAISPSSTTSTIFSSIVRADALQLLRRPRERHLRDRAGGLADPRGGATVGRDAKPLLAEQLGEVGQQVELVRDHAVARQGLGFAMSRSYGRRFGQDRPMPSSPAPRAVVCVPTYNEVDNLEPLLRALGEVIDPELDRVLVIDDNSPDGTGELADRLAAELPWVSVLHRERKEGIGAAYLAAFPRRARHRRGTRACRWTATSRTTHATCLA